MTDRHKVTCTLTNWALWRNRAPVKYFKAQELGGAIPGLIECRTMDEVIAVLERTAEEHWSDAFTKDDFKQFRDYKLIEDCIESLGVNTPRLKELLMHVYWAGLPVEDWLGLHMPEPSMPRTLIELGWSPGAFLAETVERLCRVIEQKLSEAA